MRILVADDEWEMTVAPEALLRREHYSVDVVYSGQDVLDHGLAENYDCLVLDITMSKLDGIQVLQALRVGNVATPVLLTAKSQIEDRVAGLDSGADDYLPKPFDNLERQFVTDASHELKTPLAILAADLGLLEDTHGQDPWLESARAQTVRLDKLIKNLVELSRTEETVGEDAASRFSVSQAASACTAGGGCGTSLSTAKAIVTRHRGRITNRYADGVITFTALIPQGG